MGARRYGCVTRGTECGARLLPADMVCVGTAVGREMNTDSHNEDDELTQYMAKNVPTIYGLPEGALW